MSVQYEVRYESYHKHIVMRKAETAEYRDVGIMNDAYNAHRVARLLQEDDARIDAEYKARRAKP